MAEWNVIKRNIWTREERIADTTTNAIEADRIALRILLDLPNYVAWRLISIHAPRVGSDSKIHQKCDIYAVVYIVNSDIYPIYIPMEKSA